MNFDLIRGEKFVFGQKWVKSQGFRSGQALMLWKCLYGNNNWAQSCDELAGFVLSLVFLLILASLHLLLLEIQWFDGLVELHSL